MSSGLASNPGAARNMLGGIAGKAIPDGAEERINNGGGMSPRQFALDRLWRYYRCQNYDNRRLEWDGSVRADHLETEAIASQGAVPPGFVDAGASMVPLRFRKPSAPYYLGRAIVDRFTGLLFSSKRHPKVTVEGDPQTEGYLNAVIEAGRLWSQMNQARNFGGAMGTVAIGFSIVKGKPVFEVFDPRWATPVFLDRTTQELESIEIRYQYPEDVRDPQTGQWVEAWFWYRRVINETIDAVWPKVPVGDGDEPAWDKYRNRKVEHGLGECPVQWIQNAVVQDDVDGDPDCHGCYDMIERIDALNAQADRGIISNCDPSLVIKSDHDLDTMGGLTKGSGAAIKLEAGGGADYLEIDGTGPKAAREMADGLEQKVLLMAHCVLDQARSAVSKTATEVDRDYSAMWERADVLREQYGEKGVKRLLEKALRMLRKVTGEAQLDPETGRRVRQVVLLPKKPIEQADGSTVYVDHVLGATGETITLRWPGYTQATLDDAGKAVKAAADAVAAGILDLEHAAKFIADYFHVEDIAAMLAKIKNEAEAQQQAAAATSFYGMPPGMGG